MSNFAHQLCNNPDAHADPLGMIWLWVDLGCLGFGPYNVWGLLWPLICVHNQSILLLVDMHPSFYKALINFSISMVLLRHYPHLINIVGLQKRSSDNFMEISSILTSSVNSNNIASNSGSFTVNNNLTNFTSIVSNKG